MAHLKQKRHWLPTTAILLLLGVGGTTGCGSSSSSSTASASSGPFRATSSQVEAVFNDVLGSTSGKAPRVISSRCRHGVCTVRYHAKEIVIGADETLRDQRPIWKKLFSDPHFKRATFIPYTTLVSVGGQQSNGAMMEVRCDRQANAQIDWDNVGADGMKQLCTVVPLIKIHW